MTNGNGSFGMYLRDIGRFPMISLEREIELTRAIKQATNADEVEKAVVELVQANLRLVVHCVKDFYSYLHHSGVSALDLVAEGNVALMKAARKFNPDYRAEDAESDTAPRFCTYAYQCIKSAMRRAIMQSRFIHIPEHHFICWSRLDELKRESGDLADHEIMARLDISEGRLRTLRESSQTSAVMLEDMTTDDEGSHWADRFEDVSARPPSDWTEMMDLNEILMEELRCLPARTREMLCSMFLSNTFPTLAELSQQYGISKERCRQICVRGLHVLKKQILQKWTQNGNLEAFGIVVQPVDSMAASTTCAINKKFPLEPFEHAFVA